VYNEKRVAVLLRFFGECEWEEQIDLKSALGVLNGEERRFLSYILAGWSIREAGRRIGKPGHTHRRFMRCCTKMTQFLNGGKHA